MLIKQVRVRNFRSVLDETLPCESLSALVGRNGTGKSAFLSAIELFYATSPTVTPEDFYGEDTTRDIEVTITFEDLSTEARALFASYLQQDLLTVVRVFSEGQGSRTGTYHGTRLQNPNFDSVRNAGGRREIIQKYGEIRVTDKYSSLPPARSSDAALAAMEEGEVQNPEECSLQRDDGQFFGFTQVARGYLGRFTTFLLIPAVRDAHQDATEGRGSPITQMMNLVVRNALINRQELTDFKRRTQEQYSEIAAPSRLVELLNLQTNLSQTLRSFVPDASVIIDWSDIPEISFPNPQALVNLVEDGYQSSVDRTGHGLQRAFIATMLQHLATARDDDVPADDSESEEDPSVAQMPNLVLAIEEPELYQHPSRQRHLASVLSNLASGNIPGVAERTQVIYTTHSPLMVGLDRFDQIRVLRKVFQESDQPKITVLTKADAQAIATELWNADGATGEEYTASTLRARLQTLMTPWMNEGFFADSVVLVEGEDDRAALVGIARSLDIDFDREGISIIPCFGKNNLARPFAIFRQLGIPVYVVWDGDNGQSEAKPEGNISLLRILGQPEEDWPEFVRDTCACFKENLEKTLEEEIGQNLFDQLLKEAQENLGIPKKKHAVKNVSVIEYIIENANAEGKTSNSVEGIVNNIVALNNHQQHPTIET